MLKKINTETKIGGLFGIIGLIAIIVEVSLNGWSTSAIAGGIKDLAGTMVIVVLFLISAKNLIPKKQTFTYEEKMKNALDQWQNNHLPIVNRKEEFKDSKLRYFMLTDPKKFFSYNKSTEIERVESGLFLEMPLINEQNYRFSRPTLVYYLNKGTFFDHIHNQDKEVLKQLLNPKYKSLRSLIMEFVSSKYSKEYLEVHSDSDVKKFTVSFKEPIETDDDIKSYIDFLDVMVQLYLTAAHMEI